MDNDESGSEADWVCEDKSSSSSDSEEDASEVPGPSAQRGCRRSHGRRSNPVAAPARMPATSPASAPAPDPAATSPEAATSPVVVPAPPGTQETGANTVSTSKDTHSATLNSQSPGLVAFEEMVTLVLRPFGEEEEMCV
ncbi:hypothetical protein EOD39_7950 [Acipenser ruthenus]|uniref:Uncharacterized protein n=1 Tax=Acipenser ruthenus TaxID=7906 RepID=A0A444U5B9_ACIRT|nr:hypothetical protein EOD39_7950 [Acipenser ruthenus]